MKNDFINHESSSTNANNKFPKGKQSHPGQSPRCHFAKSTFSTFAVTLTPAGLRVCSGTPAWGGISGTHSNDKNKSIFHQSRYLTRSQP